MTSGVPFDLSTSFLCRLVLHECRARCAVAVSDLRVNCIAEEALYFSRCAMLVCFWFICCFYVAVGVCVCVVFVGVPCGGVSHVQVRIVTFSYDLSGDPPRNVFQEWTVGHSKMRLWQCVFVFGSFAVSARRLGSASACFSLVCRAE